MVNMWFVWKKCLVDAEDPLMSVTIWQQKIGRSSSAKLLDAEDTVVFLLMTVTFWEQKIREFKNPLIFTNKQLLFGGRRSADLLHHFKAVHNEKYAHFQQLLNDPY